MINQPDVEAISTNCIFVNQHGETMQSVEPVESLEE